MYDQFDALIFDMDGTLVDSGQLHEHAWTAMLNHYNIPIDRRLMRSLAGVPTVGTIPILLTTFSLQLSASIEEMTMFKENFAHQHMHKFVKPTALMDVVKQYHGKKPMAVGTGAMTDDALQVLALCGYAPYFTHVVGADQVQHPKPAPDTFLRCAQLLNVRQEKCVVFEDAVLGLQAAVSAGMHPVDVLVAHQIENNYFL